MNYQETLCGAGEKLEAGRPWSFDVDGHKYEMIVANTRSEREEAYSLVHRVYASQGFTESNESSLWYSIHNALPETVTFLVRNSDGQAVASGTVIPDSPLGLPMERMYVDEVEALRKSGRRVCEINSLVSTVTDEGWHSRIVILKVFSAAFAYARNVIGFDDLVCVTSPEHARFYSHVLMLDQVGGLRQDPHANGADSIALRLDVTTAEERFQARYANKSSTRNLFRFFRPSGIEVLEFVEWLSSSIRTLDERTFRHFFVERYDLVSSLGTDASDCIRNARPRFDVQHVGESIKELVQDQRFAVA